jgi:homoserine O-acetyltransferase
MGGMHVWVWGERYPDYMDGLVPMASQPTGMASRNWMLRRVMLETIRSDPDYNNGNCAGQPHSLKYAAIFFGIATSGGTLNYQKLASTRELADRIVDARLAAPVAIDANDFLWQWDSSADYDPAPGLEKLQAWVLAINSAETQSAGNRHRGRGDETREEWQPVSHSGGRPNQWARNHRQVPRRAM